MVTVRRHRRRTRNGTTDVVRHERNVNTFGNMEIVENKDDKEVSYSVYMRMGNKRIFQRHFLTKKDAKKFIKYGEDRQWYFGTRNNDWYLAFPSDVPDYKRKEGITQQKMKEIGKNKAKEMVLSPSFIR